ncbi:MAG: hypothetical protein LBS92_07295 [Candidatus Methanoplasma sp.]|jgi:hypothetical protein|nr:hypothetical protein [Candidatus Methanoplasma sp.]
MTGTIKETLGRPPRWWYSVFTVFLLLITPGILATSPHSVFIVSSFLFAVMSHLVANMIYLAGKETHAGRLAADCIFSGKIKTICMFWILGIAYGVFAYMLSPALASLDADMPSVGLEGLDTLSLVMLSSFPFLLLTGATTYTTYACDHNTAILVTLVLVGSVMAILTPVFYGDLELGLYGLELLLLSLSIALLSTVMFVVAVKRAKKSFCAIYDSMNPDI